MTRAIPHLVVCLALMAASSVARAQSVDSLDAPPGRTRSLDDAESGALLAGFTPARRGTGVGLAYLLGGYDAAKASPTYVAAAELRPLSRLAIRAEVASLPTSSSLGPQPRLELRWSLTTQAASGIDTTIGLAYRRDKITQDDGIVQAVVAIGRRFGRATVVANLAYGQDAEGDDRVSDLRLATLVRVRDRFVVGAAASASSELGSTDPRRAARGEVNEELQLGPTCAVGFGGWLAMAQVGAEQIDTTTRRMGAFALAGAGSVF
jgi:hypothetical protein